MVKRYAKKPANILAVRYTGYNIDEICNFVGTGNLHVVDGDDHRKIFIVTELGAVYALPGDYVTNDPDGEVHTYTKKVFDMYFEEAEYNEY